MGVKFAGAVAAMVAALTAGRGALAEERLIPGPAIAGIVLEAQNERVAIERLDQSLSTLIPRAADISQAYLGRADQMAEAKAVSEVVADILRYDLDSDGVVTRDEASFVIEHELATGRFAHLGRSKSGNATTHARDERLAEIFSHHSNGQIALADIHAKASAEAGEARSPREPNTLLHELLRLDPDRDGTVSWSEAEQITRTVYRSLDLNGDGRIDAMETGIYNEIRSPVAGKNLDGAPILLDEPPCRWAGLDPNARVIALNVAEGDTISPVAISGFNRVVTVVRVIVHPASADVVVILGAASDVIFAFEGDVNKVRRVVLTRAADTDAGAMGIGVKGISAARIERSPPGVCYVDQSQTVHHFAGRLLKRMLFKAGANRFDAATFQMVHAIRLPSAIEVENGASWSPPDAAPPDMAEDVIRHAPGGVAVLDPADIKASSAFQPRLYDVLPREAGLLQSAVEGVLEPMQIPRFWRPGYRLLKPLKRIPAGLSDVHAVGFIQPQGFPLPAGSIDGSCLFEDVTDRLLLGDPENCMRSGGVQPR